MTPRPGILETGESSIPRLAISSNSSRLQAQSPPPVPPKVYGPDDERETADLFGHRAGLFDIMRGAADGNIQADFDHEVLEDLAILALLRWPGRWLSIISTPLLQRSTAVQRHGRVEGRLGQAERGQQHQLGSAPFRFNSSTSR